MADREDHIVVRVIEVNRLGTGPERVLLEREDFDWMLEVVRSARQVDRKGGWPNKGKLHRVLGCSMTPHRLQHQH